jgi:hypothetical protein
MGEARNTYEIFMVNILLKYPLEIPRRWENIIKVDFRETVYRDGVSTVECSGSAALC